MSTFFARFPEFPYDPTNQKVHEFSRLQETQGWEASSPIFREEYKAFRLALLRETGAAVDVFFAGYKGFKYRIRDSPWNEFSRLMNSQRISKYSNEYLRTKELFRRAFDEAFDRHTDKFFKGYPEFEYNPRGELKAEFERLRSFKNWFFPNNKPERPKEKLEYEQARSNFFTTFINDFTYYFGVGKEMCDWEYLFDLLRIQPIPQTIETCIVALESYYINIFNIYDYAQWGATLIYHANQQELTSYSRRNGLVFRRELAHSTSMKALLRRFEDLDGEPTRCPSWSGTITINKRRRQRKAPEA